MFWGVNTNGMPVWSFIMDDGCEVTAAGIDRTDAHARAEGEHQGCTKHTAACNHLAKMMKTNLGVPLQCTGECHNAPTKAVAS